MRVLVVVLVVTGVKQSQLLGLRLSLEFDNSRYSIVGHPVGFTLPVALYSNSRQTVNDIAHHIMVVLIILSNKYYLFKETTEHVISDGIMWVDMFVHGWNYCLECRVLSKPQLNHNSTQPQPNMTLVGLDMKMTLQTTPPPHPTQTQCQQYLSCY